MYICYIFLRAKDEHNLTAVKQTLGLSNTIQSLRMIGIVCHIGKRLGQYSL